MTIHDRMLIDIIFDSRLRQVFHMRYVSAGPFRLPSQRTADFEFAFKLCGLRLGCG
jgi:hypothetical protein